MEEWELQPIKFCPKCNGYKFPNPVYYDMNRPCPICGETWVDTGVPYHEYSIIFDATNNNETEKFMVVNLKKQDPVKYELMLSVFREKVKNLVKCPTCGSTQIQLLNKKWGILTGFFTQKVVRVCVACKTKF